MYKRGGGGARLVVIWLLIYFETELKYVLYLLYFHTKYRSDITAGSFWVAVIRAKNHKHQRRNRQSVTAKREKSQTPKVLTAILTLPNLT